MSTRKSIIMMTNSGNEFNIIGENIKGDSFMGYSDGLHTVQFNFQNFTGGIGIQGTLALEPVEEDWFWIRLIDQRGNATQEPFSVYPKDPLRPTGAPQQQSSALTAIGDSGVDAFTFVGNFVYLRAMLTRDYIQPPPMPMPDGRWFLGQVDKVLISI